MELTCPLRAHSRKLRESPQRLVGSVAGQWQRNRGRLPTRRAQTAEHTHHAEAGAGTLYLASAALGAERAENVWTVPLRRIEGERGGACTSSRHLALATGPPVAQLHHHHGRTRHITSTAARSALQRPVQHECLTSQTLWPERPCHAWAHRLHRARPEACQCLPSGPPHEEHRGRLFTWLYRANIASRRRP